jgi:hypothetical protein
VRLVEWFWHDARGQLRYCMYGDVGDEIAEAKDEVLWPGVQRGTIHGYRVIEPASSAPPAFTDRVLKALGELREDGAAS